MSTIIKQPAQQRIIPRWSDGCEKKNGGAGDLARLRCAHPKPSTSNLAAMAWFKRGLNLGFAEGEAARCHKIHLGGDELTVELRALGDAPMDPAVTADGGGLIAAEFQNLLAWGMAESSQLLRFCTILTTVTGAPLPYPGIDISAATGRIVPTNNQGGNLDLTAVCGVKTLGAYLGSTDFLVIPTELLDDACQAFVATIPTALTTILGRLVSRLATIGTGTGEPRGFMLDVPTGVTASGTTSITSDELANLAKSVDPIYRRPAANPAFMMSDNTRLQLALMKLTTGAYTFPGLHEPEPTLLGYRVVVNQDMPAATAGLKPIAFGSMKAIAVRMVNQIRIRRLVELMADRDQDAFIGYVRFDSGISDPAGNALKCLTMHA